METTTIIGIAVAVICAAVLILFLTRRNVKDEEDTNPELTKAFTDASKQNTDEKSR